MNVFFEKLNHITGHPKSKGDVIIGNDVWIGEGVIIMGGVKIGDGAVIAAGSIVTKEVLPYQIVAGVPARHMKLRFTSKQISQLLEIRWWDFDEDKIAKFGELLMQPDIDKFINAVK